MNQADEPTYPIFVYEGGNCFYKFENLIEVQMQFEDWYIEEGHAEMIWDMNGQTYSIHLDPNVSGRYFFKKTSSEPEPDKLREALLGVASRIRTKEKLLIDPTCTEPVKIYNLIEEHVKKYSLWNRMKRKLNSLFGNEFE